METFQNINYASDWAERLLPDYYAQVDQPPSNEVSQKIIEDAYRHTSCHGRIKVAPMVFEEGCGLILRDVDGNLFMDLGSGIYCTNLGHGHPKVAEAIARQAQKLLNCHDYMTPVKAVYFQQLAEALGEPFTNFHLYDNGTTAVEFAIRAARAITGKHEIISCFSDHHGKTAGSSCLGRMSAVMGPSRWPGFYMVPRPDPYRPIWKKADGSIDTDAYIDFYDLFIKEATVGQVAAFILEPIQGWGGTIIPPDDFFPKLSDYCQKKNILLITDEILTGSGRTGKWFCGEHWNIEPDLTLLGKGIGNGFPMAVLVAKDQYADRLESIAPSTTFGGNPIACAAGLATLELLREENLMERALTIGDYMLERLGWLKERHSIIGDVRGKGCILGMEMVKDRKTRTPYPEACAIFYRECLKRKLIPGVPVIHLLRIAPPLITDRKAIDAAISIFDRSLTATEEILEG